MNLPNEFLPLVVAANKFSRFKTPQDYLDKLVAYSVLVFFGHDLDEKLKQHLISLLPGYFSPPMLPLTDKEFRQERANAINTLCSFVNSPVFDTVAKEGIKYQSRPTDYTIRELEIILGRSDAYYQLLVVEDGEETDPSEGFRIDAAAVSLLALLEVYSMRPDFVETNVKQNILGFIYGLGTGVMGEPWHQYVARNKTEGEQA